MTWSLLLVCHYQFVVDLYRWVGATSSSAQTSVHLSGCGCRGRCVSFATTLMMTEKMVVSENRGTIQNLHEPCQRTHWETLDVDDDA